MASNNPFTVSSITNPFTVNSITKNSKPSDNDYNTGNTIIPGLRQRTLGLSKFSGSIYEKPDVPTEFKKKEDDKENEENEENKEDEEVKQVGPPKKESVKDSLKKWFTPRIRGGKKNKKRNKSKRKRRSARK